MANDTPERNRAGDTGNQSQNGFGTPSASSPSFRSPDSSPSFNERLNRQGLNMNDSDDRTTAAVRDRASAQQDAWNSMASEYNAKKNGANTDNAGQQGNASPGGASSMRPSGLSSDSSNGIGKKSDNAPSFKPGGGSGMQSDDKKSGSSAGGLGKSKSGAKSGGSKGGIAPSALKGLEEGAGAGIGGLASSVLPGGAALGLAKRIFGSIKPNTKKKKLGLTGLIIAALLGGGAIVASPMSGPLHWILLAENLAHFNFGGQDSESSSRAGKIIKSVYYKHDASKTRLGYLANRNADGVAKKMAKNGFRMDVDKVTGNFRGFEFDRTAVTEGDFKGVGGGRENVKQQLADGLAIDKSQIEYRGDGKYYIKADGFKRLSNGRMIGRVYGISTSRGKVYSAFQKRLLIKRAGLTFDPITKLKNKANQKIVDRFREVREERSQRLTGKEKAAGVTATGSSDSNNNEDPESKKAADDGNKLADDAKSGKLSSTKLAGGAAAAVAFLCIVKSVSDQASETNLQNLVTVSLQVAAETQSVASKVQDGKDVDYGILGVYSQSLTSDTNGDALSSNILLNELNGPTSSGTKLPDTLDPTKSKNVGSQILGQVPGLGPVCAVLNNTVVSIVLSVAGGPISIIQAGFFASPAGQALFNKIVSLFVRSIPDMSDPVNAGGVYGEAAGLGTRLMANETAFATGGRIQTDNEENQGNLALLEEQKADLKTQSFKDRYLNPYLATSMAGKFLSTMTFSPSNQSFSSAVAGTFGSLPHNLFSMISPQAMAANTKNKRELYYNIPKVGFITKDSAADDNPAANADKAADLLQGPDAQKYIDKLQDCNNVQVNFDKGLDFTTGSGVTTNYDADIPKDCNDSSDPNFVVIRNAVFDTTVAKAMFCLDFGDDESCDSISGSQASDTDGSGGSGTSTDGWVWPVHSEDLDNKTTGLAQCWLSYYQPKDGYHAAVDIAVTNKPVYAAHAGTVKDVTNDDYNTLIIDAGPNPSTPTQHLYEVYEHMSSITVKEGQKVLPNDRIGTSGSVGATAPHLHFGISDSASRFGFYADPWRTANPLDFLPADYDAALEKSFDGSCKTADIKGDSSYGFSLYKTKGSFDAYK